MLTFALRNRQFIHEISKAQSERILVFQAGLGGFDQLNVKGKGEVTEGIVRIHEGEPGEEIARIIYVPAWVDSDSGSACPHCFQVETRVPPNTFQTLLDYDEQKASFQLILNFDMADRNLRYGWAPDGSVVDWDVERQAFEVAHSVTLICGNTDEAENT